MADTIPRLNAALEGRYAIDRELGAGGMATVYLADDLKHERKVALKVLKPELAAVVGAERFLAEIKTTANLKHPHILPLFDSGEADSFLFYVMPYLEGETLRDRIDREKQLPVDEAVAIASKVAGALQHAHEHGVIHRDIKPANILLQDGEPVVADFGISLALGVAGGTRLTETGLSVGTPFYMSPEQATGDQAVGASTDTYALGSVLYEMLVGEPPYPGMTAQAVLGKIIAGKPVSATEQRPSIPANVDAAVRKALEKLPADRFASAQDFAQALADPGFRYGELVAGDGGVSAGQWNRLTMGFAALAAVSTLIAGWSLFGPEPSGPPQRVERFASPFGKATPPTFVAENAFALSPDGSKLVYRGAAEGAAGNQLWLRQWNDLDPLPVRGTTGGIQPAVSPDGERLAFSSGGQITVLAFEGGPATTVGPGVFPRWGPDAYIYTAGDSGAVRMPATGGAVEQVTRLGEGEAVHVVGDFLPGGDGALLMVVLPGGDIEIHALNLNTGETRFLVAGDFPRYAQSGHLVYVSDGTLMAARFDPRAMELLDSPVALVDDVLAFTLSDDGKLFYSSGASGLNEFVWVSRSGQATPVEVGWSFDAGGGNAAWSLSPDGTRLAVRETTNDNQDIWIKELDNGPHSRLTFDEAQDWSPHWTPDGDMVTFASNRAGGGVGRDVWTKRADGIGDAELLYDEAFIVEGFWSPDGEWLVLRGGAAGAGANTRDILAIRPGVDSLALPLLAEEYDEQQPALSPDGRWIAYISNEAGSNQVYVRPFPDVNTGKWQVSTGGGIMPVWAHSGQELFFVDDGGSLVAAQIDTEQGFRVGEKETLFRLPPGLRTSPANTLFGVAPDDQRFLMARVYQIDSQGSADSGFVLVNNFFQELRERVGN